MMPTREDLEAIGMTVTHTTEARPRIEDDPALAGPVDDTNEIVERKLHLMAMSILKALREEPLSYDELRAAVVGRSIHSPLFDMAFARLLNDRLVEHNVEADEIAQVL